MSHHVKSSQTLFDLCVHNSEPGTLTTLGYTDACVCQCMHMLLFLLFAMCFVYDVCSNRILQLQIDSRENVFVCEIERETKSQSL